VTLHTTSVHARITDIIATGLIVVAVEIQLQRAYVIVLLYIAAPHCVELLNPHHPTTPAAPAAENKRDADGPAQKKAGYAHGQEMIRMKSSTGMAIVRDRFRSGFAN